MGPPAGSIRRIGPDATPDPVESDRIGKAQRAEAQRDAPRGASSFGVFRVCEVGVKWVVIA